MGCSIVSRGWTTRVVTTRAWGDSVATPSAVRGTTGGYITLDLGLDATPTFVEARRYRAVVLARQGKWDRAMRDINWCLDREPGSGDTLYAAACVAARAAEASPTPDAVDRALELLRRAIAHGSGKKAFEDPDLLALRRDPRFGQLIVTSFKTELGIGSGISTPDSCRK